MITSTIVVMTNMYHCTTVVALHSVTTNRLFTINSLSDLAASGPSQEWRLINLLGTILRDDLVGTAGAVSTTMGVAGAGGSRSEVVVGDSSTTIIHRHLSQAQVTS